MWRSKAGIYLHFVWATHQRLPLVTGSVEQGVYARILQEAQKHSCDVLALGGMPDHVHLLLKMPTKQSPAFLMQRIKGGSSAFVRDRLIAPGEFFGWQDNYGVFSVSPVHSHKVTEHINGQKQHHAAGTCHPAWEETHQVAG